MKKFILLTLLSWVMMPYCANASIDDYTINLGGKSETVRGEIVSNRLYVNINDLATAFNLHLVYGQDSDLFVQGYDHDLEEIVLYLYRNFNNEDPYLKYSIRYGLNENDNSIKIHNCGTPITPIYKQFDEKLVYYKNDEAYIALRFFAETAYYSIAKYDGEKRTLEIEYIGTNWRESFQSFLLGILENLEHEDYQYPYYFALYDMNQDGVPELFYHSLNSPFGVGSRFGDFFWFDEETDSIRYITSYFHAYEEETGGVYLEGDYRYFTLYYYHLINGELETIEGNLPEETIAGKKEIIGEVITEENIELLFGAYE